MHKSSTGWVGCLIIIGIFIWVLAGVAWRFLTASWPTWAFLILAIVLVLVVRTKKENLFFKATGKVLTPVAVALGILMAFEVLFGLFKSFFSDERVGAVEDAILKAHFAIEGSERHLGYVIPLCVAIAVAFLCLTVGNWEYSSALAKLRDAFRFVSVALLVMASFTFFRHDATTTLLNWERDKNQGLYEMALADEERSVARLIASRELFKPLTHLDPDSKKNFEAFFGRLKTICEGVACFRERYEVMIDLYGKPSVYAFRDTIHQKVDEDYSQFVPKKAPATEPKQTLDDLFPKGMPDKGSFPYGGVPLWIDDNLPADIDLASSKSPQERLLGRRASSQKERKEQKQTVQQQQKRTDDMGKLEHHAKERTTEAFAAALAAAVPDAEGIIGAYVKQLIDATAEWVVRPVVNQMFRQGYRPETIDDLHFAVEALPQTMSETFGKFHSVGTQSSETSKMAKPNFVEDFFNHQEESVAKEKKEMTEQLKKMQEEEEHDRVE